MVSTKLLKEFTIFQGLNEAQLQKLVNIAREDSYPSGAVLFKEGGEAKNLYIVEQGKTALEMKVEMGAHRPPRQVTVDVVAKGEALGWSSVIEPYIYTLSAICIDATRLVAFDGVKLKELLQQDPVLGYEVMKGVAKLLASRLTHTRIMLTSERGLALLTEY